MIMNTILAATASLWLLFISAFIFSWICLDALLQLSYKKKKGTLWLCLFSTVNAFLTVLWNFYDTSARPLSLLIIPTIIIFDLYILTKDTWWAYLNFYFLTLLDEFSLYGISSAIVVIILRNPWPIGSDEHRRTLLTMTFLMASKIFWDIPRNKVMTVSELSELLHSKTKGKILFGSVISASMVLLTSAIFILPLIYDASLSRQVHLMINADLLLKNTLILFGSFVIVIFHVWQEKKERQLEAIDSELKMERQFRENSQEDAILRFCFDVSLGEITEGLWFFQSPNSGAEQDSASILDEFRTFCVYETERKYFIPLKDLEENRDKLKIPFYSFNARMSVDYLLNRMNLSESVQEMLRGINKEWIWIKVQVTIVEDEGSGDTLCHVLFIDIDEEMTYSENLLLKATTDALTGVHNRASMEKTMKEMFATEKVSGALFMIDMDHFKSVNDTLGHPKGDKALQEAAEILRRIFRGRDMICRLGGDEFCVFANNFTDMGLLCKRAEELNRRGRITQFSEDRSKAVDTSFSIGIAICGEGEKIGSYEELYSRADLALYEAKKAGRDTYRIYSKEMEKD